MDGFSAAPGVIDTAPAGDVLNCLQPILDGKAVAVWGGDAEGCREALCTAAGIRRAPRRRWTKGEVLICLDPGRAAEFCRLPITAAALAAGDLVVALSDMPRLPEAPEAAHAARYACRLVRGAIVQDSRFPRSRVLTAQRPVTAPAPDLHILMWSSEPLPALASGLYECNGPGEVSVLGAGPEMGPDRVERPVAGAVALANRLLKVEDRTLELRREIRALKARLAERGGAGPAAASHLDAAAARHSWPLVETPGRDPAALGLYDRRPDDAAILAAQAGLEFMEAHGLLGQAPDFGRAVGTLNAMPRALRLEAEAPDVSIVIPIYGQLPYTLNCLHSLFMHRSRYSAEIIVIDDCSPDRSTEEHVPRIAGVCFHRQGRNGGFIQSCNTGGALAKGRYVLMLNNDTRVVDEWLDELIDGFSLFPRAGLVGSKMLYPDGSLQEAGGIVWRDGGAWNYGRNDDPNDPRYCFARQVDYISGCSVVLRKDVWDELGGFDPHYAPAYAEDVDLCQRVISRGLEVWFQPRSRVVHYEGRTSGTSTSGGVKAYQVTNLRKLFLRWRDRFENFRRNAEAPYLERERHVRKRILFIDAVTPTPDQDAGSAQIVMAQRCAQAVGYKVCFAPEDNWLFDPRYTPRMQREGVECFYAPFDVGLDNYLGRYGSLFDIVMVYRVNVLHKALPAIRRLAPQALVLFHVSDLHYLRQQRQARLDGDTAALQAAENLKVLEFDMVRESDCTITHSTVEAEILAQEVPEAPVTVWPLMSEVAGTTTPFEARRDICFLGGYRHPPNVDAVFFFVREVLPLIHAERPEIRFIIAGANPTAELLQLASDRIIVTGMVDDLADVFDRSRVFACPLRAGAGAKGKVMSALSYGLPVVSTAIGVEGAGLEADRHVVVADTPEALAAALLRVYDDRLLWQALSDAGQDLVREQFSLAMGKRQLSEAIEKGYRKRLGLLDA
ncbi:glycosyltransferase [Belnapia rosea]|uniref:glycosyltransferase n=1 Tax=Belnapia rosea TaxID=938405 RepID=UPI000883D6EF|nr:glycosyltransferase [Belnapia rosea]SDB74838.1 Glycosyltransferase, GT2 family [Belnapia rosea]